MVISVKNGGHLKIQNCRLSNVGKDGFFQHFSNFRIALEMTEFILLPEPIFWYVETTVGFCFTEKKADVKSRPKRKLVDGIFREPLKVEMSKKGGSNLKVSSIIGLISS